MGGEENYVQVNSPHCNRQFGLQTGPKFCRCKVTALPFSPSFLTPSTSSLLFQGKHSGGQQGHSARCAKSYQQTGSGSKSVKSRKGSTRMCECVCVIYEQVGRKKVQHSHVLVLTPLSELERKLCNISQIAIEGTCYSFKTKHCHTGSPHTHRIFHPISRC